MQRAQFDALRLMYKKCSREGTAAPDGDGASQWPWLELNAGMAHEDLGKGASAGRCVVVPQESIHDLDPEHYDGYMNSRAILREGAYPWWINCYAQLLVADLDTFPTPGLVTARPAHLMVNRITAWYTGSGWGNKTHPTRPVESGIRFPNQIRPSTFLDGQNRVISCGVNATA